MRMGVLRAPFRALRYLGFPILVFAGLGGWWKIAPQHVWSLDNDLFRVGFTDDDNNVVFTAGMVDKSLGPNGGPLHVVDRRTGALTFTTPFPNTRENRDESWLRFDGKRTTAALDFGKQSIQVCDLVRREAIGEFTITDKFTGRIRGCCFSAKPHELFLLVEDGSKENWIRVDLATGEFHRALATELTDNAWCSDGENIALTATHRHNIEVWNLQKRERIWHRDLGANKEVVELRADAQGHTLLAHIAEKGLPIGARIAAFSLATGEPIWDFAPERRVEFEEDFADRFLMVTKFRRGREIFHGRNCVIVPEWQNVGSTVMQTKGIWVFGNRSGNKFQRIDIPQDWQEKGTHFRPRSTNSDLVILETSTTGPPKWFRALPELLRNLMKSLYESTLADTQRHSVLLYDPAHPELSHTLTQTVRVAGEPLLSQSGKWLLTSTIEARQTTYHIYAFPFQSGWLMRALIAIAASVLAEYVLLQRRRRNEKTTHVAK